MRQSAQHTLECAHCLAPFVVRAYRLGRAKYCSLSCGTDAKRKTATFRCLECGEQKGPADFFKSTRRASGYVARCKHCCRQKQGDDRANSPKRRFSEAKSNALRRGIAWHLTFDHYVAWIWGAQCHFCGCPNQSGVDRLNNEPFYAASNAVPCCTRCNMMKGTMGQSEFFRHIVTIAAHLGLSGEVASQTVPLLGDAISATAQRVQ